MGVNPFSYNFSLLEGTFAEILKIINKEVSL